MDYISVENTKKISGKVEISGAKNASLPLLAMCILARNEVEIENMPLVADIKTFLKLIELLGGEYFQKGSSFFISTKNLKSLPATYEIVKTMRASILVLGPLLARFRECKVSLPGGCAIGQRPVDLHLKALEAMGAQIIIEGGYIHAKAPNGLKGADIIFDKITVTGTANVVFACALASGKTRLINCAKEPEVVQVCEALRDAG
ncbi:MAG: UDP-N-acetylglucosamine 1-carboxyvinyltransferase, partial [Deltaproteobacteria bacterium]